MSKEWDRENMKTLACRVRKEEAEAFRQFAETCGSSTHAILAAFVRGAVFAGDDQLRFLSMENQRLAVQLAKKKEELNNMKDLARRLDERASHAEELVRKYVLEKVG